jgi:predicted Abi (CAAX) family protease
MRTIRNAISELFGLIVEDGYVAIGALLALAAAYGLTRDGALGPVAIVGWILIVLTATALMGSLARAARLHRQG